MDAAGAHPANRSGSRVAFEHRSTLDRDSGSSALSASEKSMTSLVDELRQATPYVSAAGGFNPARSPTQSRSACHAASKVGVPSARPGARSQRLVTEHMNDASMRSSTVRECHAHERRGCFLHHLARSSLSPLLSQSAS